MSITVRLTLNLGGEDLGVPLMKRIEKAALKEGYIVSGGKRKGDADIQEWCRVVLAGHCDKVLGKEK